MDQIRPMNGPMNLYSVEVFFIVLCFSPAMGMVGGKKFKKCFKMTGNTKKFH